MRPTHRIAWSLALAACLSAAMPPVARSTEAGPTAASDPARRLEERRAWATQVRALRAQERAELDSLSRSLGQLPPGSGLARAQRDLEDAKRNWRRRMLQAQLERAHSAGKPENAARLRTRLAELDERGAQRATDKLSRGER